jgi:tetratricopeptide (TPR) repeat protein
VVKQDDRLATRARKLWDERKLDDLQQLQRDAAAARDAEALYFVGLALNALNQRREAIECWRKARKFDPQSDTILRALAYELLEQAPVEAAELFGNLVGMQRANADDLTCLGELRIKQDRLGEARRWLEQALHLEPTNSLALLALASLYAQVKDSSLALSYLQKAADTEDIDLSDLAADPEFEFLWHEPKFKKIVAPNGRI